MPPIGKIDRLPEVLRKQIEDRIVAQDYKGYDAIAAALKADGYDITADNLYRHERKLHKKTEQANRETATQRAYRRLKEELKRAGIRLHNRAEPVERLLMELGALRLRERVILSRLSAVADLAEIEPNQTRVRARSNFSDLEAGLRQILSTFLYLLPRFPAIE